MQKNIFDNAAYVVDRSLETSRAGRINDINVDIREPTILVTVSGVALLAISIP